MCGMRGEASFIYSLCVFAQVIFKGICEKGRAVETPKICAKKLFKSFELNVFCLNSFSLLSFF